MADLPTLRVLPCPEVADRACELAALLLDAVEDGASIGFLASASQIQVECYWTTAAQPERGFHVMVAQDASGIQGVVIVAPILNDIQSHRSEIFKMVIHRRARGRGLARLLMRAAEAQAVEMNRPLMTLFTRDGSAAEQLYLLSSRQYRRQKEHGKMNARDEAFAAAVRVAPQSCRAVSRPVAVGALRSPSV
jgi:ribosomal protein S18 acetylase RimI-like enzyme